MRRLLELILRTIDEPSRAQVVFALLRNRDLARRLDDALESLPDALRDVVEPLRAAYIALFGGSRDTRDRDALGASAGQVLWAAVPCSGQTLDTLVGGMAIPTYRAWPPVPA